MSNNKHFGYWVFGKDMNNVNLEKMKNNGITDIFLNYYAFTVHGESKVLSWIEKANQNNIDIHIWMQCFYDGEWHNPKTTDLSSRITEATKYANLKGVKGVHLDYLRYPGNAYKTSGGADAITNFVKKIREKNPKIFLSCAIMPENDTKYYYGQDIDALGKIVDAILPMQYKGNYNSGTSWLASTSKTFSSKATVWSGLQSYKSDDDTTLLSANELINDSKTCLTNGANGIIMFRYGLCPDINFNTLSSNNTTTNKSDNMSISENDIKTMASTVKSYVEKNKDIPKTITINNVNYTYGQIAYILSFAVNNPKKAADIFTVKDAANTNVDSLSEDVQKDDYQDVAKRIENYIKNYKQCPGYAVTKKSQKKMAPKVFIYMLARIVAWYYNNNQTMPNYATVNTSYFTTSTSTTVSTPKSSKSKILNKDIYTLAQTVKASVEKNKKLESSFKVSDITYTNTEVAYIFAFAINNLKSDVSIPGIKAPSNFAGGQAINEDIYTSDYQDQAKRIVQYVKQNGQLPLYVTSVKSKKQISVQMFTYAFAKTLVWYANNKNTLPNYCNYNTSAFGVAASTSTSISTSTSTSTSTSSSTKKKYGHSKVHCCNDMGQNNGYYCGPHSLQEVFRNLTGKVVNQSTIAGWAGTTSAGTDHDGLNTAVKKFNSNYGFNLSVEWKSFSDVGWSGIKKIINSDNQDCVIHNLYRNQWGHYEVINKDYSNYCDVQNSLGDKCSSGCYYGYVEERSHSTYQSYINGISQKSVMIITRK